jgi:hypothetical protein
MQIAQIGMAKAQTRPVFAGRRVRNRLPLY